MSKLTIADQPYFDAVVAFAKQAGMYEGEQPGSLKQRLDWLERFVKEPAKVQVRLYRDFAPYSFGFTVEHYACGVWKAGLVGGLIFHGAHDGLGSGSAPSYSTTLTPTSGWSIHT